jgi:hypothetical protein
MNFSKSFSNFHSLEMEFTSQKEGVNHWNVFFRGYPEELMHLSRLIFPCLGQKSFSNVEEYAASILKATKKFKAIRVIDHLDWKEYALHSRTFRHGNVATFFKKYLNQRQFSIIKEIISDYDGIGFPDIISVSKDLDSIQVWEVKGPGDNINSQQREVLRELQQKGKVEANIINVDFKDSTEKKNYKQRRKGRPILRESLAKDVIEERFCRKVFKIINLASYDQKLHAISVINKLYKARGKLYSSYGMVDEYFPTKVDDLRLLKNNYELLYSLVYVDTKTEIPIEDKLYSKDIADFSKFSFEMGYKRWWLFLILLFPHMKKMSYFTRYSKLLSDSVGFAKAFNTHEEFKLIKSFHRSYTNEDFNRCLNVAYNTMDILSDKYRRF